MALKYINTAEHGIVIFSSIIKHDAMLRNLSVAGVEPVIKSAGFVNVICNSDGDSVFQCFGESISIGVKADKVKDSATLNNTFEQF